MSDLGGMNSSSTADKGGIVPAVTYGQPGQTLGRAPIKGGIARSRRGAFFERRVAAAIDHWLRHRVDTIPVFHDLTNFTNVKGANLDAIDLGRSNIDHLLLTGRGWVMLDAKGCGAGTLGVDGQGKGILTDTTGNVRPQPWMDDQHSYSRAGIAYRLTGGKRGAAVWVVPEETHCDESIAKARFAERGATILNIKELAEGALDVLESLVFPTPGAAPRKSSGYVVTWRPRLIPNIRATIPRLVGAAGDRFGDGPTGHAPQADNLLPWWTTVFRAD